jgi:hypothetical protein
VIRKVRVHLNSNFNGVGWVRVKDCLICLAFFSHWQLRRLIFRLEIIIDLSWRIWHVWFFELFLFLHLKGVSCGWLVKFVFEKVFSGGWPVNLIKLFYQCQTQRPGRNQKRWSTWRIRKSGLDYNSRDFTRKCAWRCRCRTCLVLFLVGWLDMHPSWSS